MKKAIVTVIGHDRVGIIAAVSTCLAKYQVNILDITQTVLQNYFTMIMLTDISKTSVSYEELVDVLNQLASDLEMTIRIQHEDIFEAMHRI